MKTLNTTDLELERAREELINSEKTVTKTLNSYGEESLEYKKALKAFASKWKHLINYQNSIDHLFD